MKLSILVPFRDADGTRTRAKEWMLARWAHFYPDAEIIEASDDGVDPFNKPMAINNAARQATGDIYALLDADTWVDEHHVRKAIAMVEEQRIAWAIPARHAYRLQQKISERIMSQPPSSDPFSTLVTQYAETSTAVVGFLHIVTRSGFEMIGGMDERFRGWGGDDTTFTWAMDRVVGPHRKLNGIVWSLWHERPRGTGGRIWRGQDRTKEQDKHRLAQQYSKARTREAMLQVLGRPVDTPALPARTPPWRRQR